MTFGFAKEDLLWDDTPLKWCKETRQCCYECSVICTIITNHWMHAEAGWFLLKIHGTAWLSRKRLRGARCTLRSWQKCLKSFRLNLHLCLHRKNKIQYHLQVQFWYPIPIKKSMIFYQPISNPKNPKFGPFLLNLFDLKVTTMDLCNLGTDAASTLAVGSRILKVLAYLSWRLPCLIGYFRRKNGGDFA